MLQATAVLLGRLGKFRRFWLSCAQPRKRINFHASARKKKRGAKKGELLAQKRGFAQQNHGRAASERHLERLSRFGGKNPAVFHGACSNYFSRSAKKNGSLYSADRQPKPPDVTFHLTTAGGRRLVVIFGKCTTYTGSSGDSPPLDEKRPKSAGSSHERSWLSLLRSALFVRWCLYWIRLGPTAMHPRPGVYLAEETVFATRFARWRTVLSTRTVDDCGRPRRPNCSCGPFWVWGASTPVPLSSPPALLRRARRSRSRRRAPRRRHARFQEIIELGCISFLKVSAACGSSCETRSARSLALAMHPATSRRRSSPARAEGGEKIPSSEARTSDTAKSDSPVELEVPGWSSRTCPRRETQNKRFVFVFEKIHMLPAFHTPSADWRCRLVTSRLSAILLARFLAY